MYIHMYIYIYIYIYKRYDNRRTLVISALCRQEIPSDLYIHTYIHTV